MSLRIITFDAAQAPTRSLRFRLLDRHWLLTSTTHGTRLPGDSRGFVCPVRGFDGRLVRHNLPGTSYDADHPALRKAAKDRLKSAPVRLSADQAAMILEQFQLTARHREWMLLAASVMRNHFHVVLSVEKDPDPSSLLRDLKSYASRALNRHEENARRWREPPG